ncbi:hypothetical protein IAT38_005214 [Cryptococcus sp. DSM 104549]
MAAIHDTDAQFVRAVDIVQSFPKGGPVQTTYEEKLWLYSLYKQGTEGDISVPRPGMLDLLGKAKWDSWNKQKGIGKGEAKRLYVNALLRILGKYVELESVQGYLRELESFSGIDRSRASLRDQDRPLSPASSSSSYHSSQASPPRPPLYNLLPPDPNLPPPDVAPSIVPPSALTSSHRSLLSLAQSPANDTYMGVPSGVVPISQVQAPGSRAHSLAGGRVGSEGYGARGGSVHSFRQRSGFEPPPRGALRPLGSPQIPVPTVRDRDFIPQSATHTPDTQAQASPYLGIHQPTPIYPSRRPGPGSASTFSQAPHVPPAVSIPYTLQQIQTSLTALHERLSTLERTQAMILRREERKKGWFWGDGDDELDREEDEAARERWAAGGGRTTTTIRVKRKKSPLGLRVVWYLLKAVRRALVDVGVGVLILIIAGALMGGGWRRARGAMGRIRGRAVKMITDGLQ